MLYQNVLKSNLFHSFPVLVTHSSYATKHTGRYHRSSCITSITMSPQYYLSHDVM